MQQGGRIGVRTVAGAIPGAKGFRTRCRLLAEVEQRCLSADQQTITVAEVTRAAETSPATFYHYFADVSAAVAEIAADHMRKFEPVLALASAYVREGCSKAAAEELVCGVYDFWTSRPGLLDALLTAKQGERLSEVLVESMGRLVHVLAGGLGPESRYPKAVATSLVTMLCVSAARRERFTETGIPSDELLAAQAEILWTTVRPQPAVSG